MHLLKAIVVILVSYAASGFRIPNFQRFVNNYKANLLFNTYNPKASLSNREMMSVYASLDSEINHPIVKDVSLQRSSMFRVPNIIKRISTATHFALKNAGLFMLYGTSGMVSWSSFTAEPVTVPETNSPYFPSIYWFSPFNNGTGQAEEMSQECVDTLSPHCMEFASKVEKMNKNMAEQAKVKGEKPRTLAVGIVRGSSQQLPTAYSAALKKTVVGSSKQHPAADTFSTGPRRIEVRTVTKADKQPTIKTVEPVKEMLSPAAISRADSVPPSTVSAAAAAAKEAENRAKMAVAGATATLARAQAASAAAEDSSASPAAPAVPVVKKTRTPRAKKAPATAGLASGEPVKAVKRQNRKLTPEDREFNLRVKALQAYKNLNGDYKISSTFVVPSLPFYPKETHGMALGGVAKSFALSKHLEPHWREKLVSIGFLNE